jgi:hypothetical protein
MKPALLIDALLLPVVMSDTLVSDVEVLVPFLVDQKFPEVLVEFGGIVIPIKE